MCDYEELVEAIARWRARVEAQEEVREEPLDLPTVVLDPLGSPEAERPRRPLALRH